MKFPWVHDAASFDPGSPGLSFTRQDVRNQVHSLLSPTQRVSTYGRVNIYHLAYNIPTNPHLEKTSLRPASIGSTVDEEAANLAPLVGSGWIGIQSPVSVFPLLAGYRAIIFSSMVTANVAVPFLFLLPV